MKVFFDLEFTGLHQHTTPISIGLVAENGQTFYGQFTDYDQSQCDDWIKENVIAHLKPLDEVWNYSPHDWEILGDTKTISEALRKWFAQFDEVEMWGDCLGYDWVLFCEIFGGAFSIPENIYYIPFDICTYFKLMDIDPDINRQKFANVENSQHNSLDDAKVIFYCYRELQGLKRWNF